MPLAVWAAVSAMLRAARAAAPAFTSRACEAASAVIRAAATTDFLVAAADLATYFASRAAAISTCAPATNAFASERTEAADDGSRESTSEAPRINAIRKVSSPEPRLALRPISVANALACIGVMVSTTFAGELSSPPDELVMPSLPMPLLLDRCQPSPFPDYADDTTQHVGLTHSQAHTGETGPPASACGSADPSGQRNRSGPICSIGFLNASRLRGRSLNSAAGRRRRSTGSALRHPPTAEADRRGHAQSRGDGAEDDERQRLDGAQRRVADMGRRGEVEHPPGQLEARAEEGDEGYEGEGRPARRERPGPQADERERQSADEELGRQVCRARPDDATQLHRGAHRPRRPGGQHDRGDGDDDDEAGDDDEPVGGEPAHTGQGSGQPGLETSVGLLAAKVADGLDGIPRGDDGDVELGDGDEPVLGLRTRQPEDGFVAVTQLYIAIIATGYAVQAVGNLRGEETDGRLEPR